MMNCLQRATNLSLALATALAMASEANAVPTPVINLYYDAATGNLKLQNTTSVSQAITSFDILTLGNGSIGPVSGRPSNVGFLSTGTAILPPSAFPISNTNPNGLNGLYSEAAAINVGSALFSFAAYPGWSTANPIGPVGSYLDLGNFVVLGMNQTDLDTRFVTDPESTPPNFDTLMYGKFLFSYETSPGTFIPATGDVVALVPEPSTYALALAGLACGGYLMRRKWIK